MNTKWEIRYGIHRGTLMSRDMGVVRDLADEKSCRNYLERMERDYANMGCYIWFAYAVPPNGEKIRIHPGTPYY